MKESVLTDRAGRRSAPPAVVECAERISAYFTTVFEEISILQERLTAVVARTDVTAADVTDVALPLTEAMLARHPLYGGGFVAAPGFLADHHLYLAWWQGDDQQLLAKRAAPGSGDLFDYSRMEWYRTPVSTGRGHITGPFVDYVCSDEYILTATAPVMVGDAPAGVVGADTLLETFESLMLPAVSAADAILVNHYRRVVISADPRIPAGRLIDTDEYAVEVPCGELPLSVLAGP